MNRSPSDRTLNDLADAVIDEFEAYRYSDGLNDLSIATDYSNRERPTILSTSLLFNKLHSHYLQVQGCHLILSVLLGATDFNLFNHQPSRWDRTAVPPLRQ